MKNFSIIVALILIFLIIPKTTPLYGQYYDLTPGTERHFYECYGLTGLCLPAFGVNRVAIEHVIGESEINGVTYAMVTWTSTLNYHPEDPDAVVHIDTSYLRTYGPLLYQHTASGDSLIFDFGLAKGDSILPHIMPFLPDDFDIENDFFTFYRLEGIASVVLADTVILFPDGEYRRIMWGDDTLKVDQDIYPPPDTHILVDSLLEIRNNLPVPVYDIIFRPFYYIEDMGVMMTAANHRNIVMSGFKSADGIEFGYLNIITSVDEREGLPAEFILHQNYPNPFNPSTIIEFHLPAQEHVVLRVFDILGRRVDTLMDEVLNPGTHKITWQPNDLPSGFYIYRVTAGEKTQSKRMLYIK